MVLPTFTAGRRLRASELAALVAQINTNVANIVIARGVVTLTPSTASMTLTTTPTDITGATITFSTTTSAAKVSITGVFDFDVSVGGVAVGVGECVVDGVAQSPIATFDLRTTGNRGTVTQQWDVTLSGIGSHTIKLRCNKTAAAATATVNVGFTNMRTWVREIL